MARIVQISDPHLSHRQDVFAANFQQALAAARKLAPDLILVTGDISINGAGDPGEFTFVRHLAEEDGAPVLFIPGNHDVGDEPGAGDTDQPVTEDRLAAWATVFGPDRHAFRLNDWHVLALNSQLFSTGLPAEAEQWDWLGAELGAARGAPAVLFLHKPLFINDAAETPDGALSIPAAARDRLLALAKEGAIRIFASGHLHQGAARAIGRAGHIWAPSCAFPVKPARLAAAGLEPGFVLFDLRDGGGWSARIITPPGLDLIDYDALLARHNVTRLTDLPPTEGPGDLRIAS